MRPKPILALCAPLLLLACAAQPSAKSPTETQRIELRELRLYHHLPSTLVSPLESMCSVKAFPFDATGQLLLFGPHKDVRFAEKIVQELDSSFGPCGTQNFIFSLRHAKAEEIAALFNQCIAGGLFKDNALFPPPEPMVFVPDTRTNALIIQVPGTFADQIKDMLAQLDKPASPTTQPAPTDKPAPQP